MIKFILRKIFSIWISLFAGLTVLFIIVKLTPGTSRIQNISTAFDIVRQNEILDIYSDNKPVIYQLMDWYKNVLLLDFGYSMQNGQKVSNAVKEAFVPTLRLSLFALFWGILISLPVAIWSSIKKHKIPDRIISFVMIVVFALPSYWIGLMLLNIFSIKLHIFPSSQLYSFDYYSMTFFQKLSNNLYHLFLPSLSLGLLYSAYFYKYLRNKMIDVLDSEYILACKARGLSKNVILFSHILPNLLIPFLTLLSTIVPSIFCGTVTIEYIFSIPGLGSTMISAAISRDLPVIMGCATVSFFFILITNSLLDIIIIILNPKVKLEITNDNTF